MPASADAVRWLLKSDEPAVRYRARTWLLGAPETDAHVVEDRAAAFDGPIVAALLELPDRKVDPYRKWFGLHWRLVSLADFALPVERAPIGGRVRRQLDEGIDRELAWITNPRHLDAVKAIGGRYRAHAGIEGNALYAASRLGHAADDRARRLVDRLLAWQWPDGGWNCDPRASGNRSSFHESWETALGLAAFHDATGDAEALSAARRTAELLLEHRLYRSRDGRRTIHSSFVVPHWPAYWHYDVLAGLRVLGAVDARLLADPRAADALDLLASRALPDGRFAARRSWAQVGQHATAPVDAVDWGRARPSEVLTLHALAVLGAAGRG